MFSHKIIDNLTKTFILCTCRATCRPSPGETYTCRIRQNKKKRSSSPLQSSTPATQSTSIANPARRVRRCTLARFASLSSLRRSSSTTMDARAALNQTSGRRFSRTTNSRSRRPWSSRSTDPSEWTSSSTTPTRRSLRARTPGLRSTGASISIPYQGIFLFTNFYDFLLSGFTFKNYDRRFCNIKIFT